MSDTPVEVDHAFTHTDVEVLENKSGYDGFLKLRQLQLRHRQFAGGWGRELSREIVQRHRAVGVLLYDPALDAIALVEQFRIGALALENAASPVASPWLLELVAGLIDSAENPEQVARREALEEANIAVRDMEFVCEYFSSPGGSNEYFYLFCGHCDLSSAGGVYGLPEEGEDIRVQILPFADALQCLQDGGLCNAHTIIALQWLQLHRQRLQQIWR
ncbi:MAG TPA: NUDIX domain-containing protein [Spongiibacteraceae bacterium]|nr:NUDIX domain-containing protein [Spongiibacteraceae bacterium]